VRQPRRCILSEQWQSSVTVCVGTPPTSSSASRRITAQEPQKKAAFQRSLPCCTSRRTAAPRSGRAGRGQVPLERVGRVEVVRRLDHAEVLVAQQPADGELQEGAGRHVVAVEDGDELAIVFVSAWLMLPAFAPLLSGG
jgi:hypothetical protein